jgi:hypothetical protein
MRTQTKIFLLLALVIFVISIFVVFSGLRSGIEDDTYLTPIPENTWTAYREKRPISNQFDAVLEATQYVYYSRMTFTQGPPKVVFTEEMTLAEAKNLIPKDPSEVSSYEDRPDDTKVWLIIFEGSWQIHPPDGELLPLESGCIYTIIDANQMGRNQGRTAICQAMP